jgi:hypothetical protein
MRVEDIWDSLDKQGQLSRSGKLNSCFDSIPIALFLHTFIGDQLVEIPLTPRSSKSWTSSPGI